MRTQRAKRLGVAVVLLSVGLYVMPMPAMALEVGEKAPDFLYTAPWGRRSGCPTTRGKRMCCSSSPRRVQRRLNRGSPGFPIGSPQVRKP